MTLDKNIHNKLINIAVIILLSTHAAFAGNIELITTDFSNDQPYITVVTNRPFLYDSTIGEYFPNQISIDNELSYMKIYNQNGKFQVQKLESINAIQSSNPSLEDWLVYVHGDSQTLELTFTRGFQLQTEYGVNVIVFSWPSKDPDLGGINNFNNSRNQLENGTPGFMKFLLELDLWHSNESEVTGAKLSLFFHSLGNYYLERIANNSRLSELNPGIFDNLILNAAAVNEKDHNIWLSKIHFQKKIFVNSNRKDMTLKGVNMFTDFDVQLGEEVIDGFSENAAYVNFGQALKNENNFGLMHGYYAGEIPAKSQNIFNYYKTIFHGNDVDFSDKNLFNTNDTIPVYEIKF
jgi:esterase/lipase superfamily enzyme